MLLKIRFQRRTRGRRVSRPLLRRDQRALSHVEPHELYFRAVVHFSVVRTLSVSSSTQSAMMGHFLVGLGRSGAAILWITL